MEVIHQLELEGHHLAPASRHFDMSNMSVGGSPQYCYPHKMLLLKAFKASWYFRAPIIHSHPQSSTSYWIP